MQLYLISQSVNTDHDTFDSAVVRASSPGTAKLIHPDGTRKWKSADPNTDETDELANEDWLRTWAAPHQITVTHLGLSILKSPGVVCASFNAG